MRLLLIALISFVFLQCSDNQIDNDEIYISVIERLGNFYKELGDSKVEIPRNYSSILFDTKEIVIFNDDGNDTLKNFLAITDNIDRLSVNSTQFLRETFNIEKMVDILNISDINTIRSLINQDNSTSIIALSYPKFISKNVCFVETYVLGGGLHIVIKLSKTNGEIISEIAYTNAY